MSKYIPPKYGEEHFTCPHCGALSKHWWGAVNIGTNWTQFKSSVNVIRCSACETCCNITIWKNDGPAAQIIYPVFDQSRKPHLRMPKELLPLYREAQSVYPHSPRAASALLRGLLLWLMPHLGQPFGQRLTQSVITLSRNGLSDEVKKMLVATRAIGGNAVEPGRIAPDDTGESAHTLFEAINMLVGELLEPATNQPNRNTGAHVFENMPVKTERARRI